MNLNSVPANRRLAVNVLATVSIYALTTCLVELLISHGGRGWVSAIQASSTIALLVVTSAYAVLTSRILQVAQRQARTAEQESAIRHLTVELSKHPEFLTVQSERPFNFDFWPNQIVIDQASELSELGRTIFQWSALLPSNLFRDALNASMALNVASARVHGLISLCWLQQRDDIQQGVGWSIERLKVKFEADKGESFLGVTKWEDLVGGRDITEACEAVVLLRDALLKELQGWE